MKKIIAPILLIIITVVFIWKGTIGLDPDFGWHLKSGEYILENGFPDSDPFSYTMPSFRFIDHAWGSSTLFSSLYPTIGSFGLSLLFSILLFFSLYIVCLIGTPRKNKNRFDVLAEITLSPVFIIGVALFTSFFFVRAQIFSWFFWSLFLSFFLNRSVWNKYKFFLPLLFLFWVNLHGGFALGIFSLIVYILVGVYKKNLKLLDVSIVLACIFVTFLNPYGIDIWKEVFMTISSPLLRTNIQEWRSIIFSPDLILFCFITFSTISIFRYRTKFPLEQLFLFCFLLLQSLLSLKNVPFWILLSLPLTSRSLRIFYNEVKSIPHGKERFKKAGYFLSAIFLILLSLQCFFTVKTAYSIQEQNFYPQKAIHFLKENKKEGHIFSEYGWGGYLDWKYPEEKVFIDGRMAIWRSSSVPSGELSNAFETYIAIGKGEESYKETFSQFDITTVLWPNIKEDNDDIFSKLERRFSFILNKFTTDAKDFNFIQTLEEDGWQKVYEDDVSIIYQKPQQ